MTDDCAVDLTEPAAPTLLDGYAAMMPWIIAADTAAFLAFAEKAFGAEGTVRVLNDDGSIASSPRVPPRSQTSHTCSGG